MSAISTSSVLGATGVPQGLAWRMSRSHHEATASVLHSRTDLDWYPYIERAQQQATRELPKVLRQPLSCLCDGTIGNKSFGVPTNRINVRALKVHWCVPAALPTEEKNHGFLPTKVVH